VSGTVTRLPGADRMSRPPSPHVVADPRTSRVQVQPWVRMEIEAARCFLMELATEPASANLPRMAYLLGRLEGHAQTLLDVLDTLTEPGR
jgi:hypothetical protein